ncbi:hypothetical protein NHQ30_010689 [Ciborinia camelliae]|nr:hypothetical protein NHQ30_010689 [Ciborinia camelliae]
MDRSCFGNVPSYASNIAGGASTRTIVLLLLLLSMRLPRRIRSSGAFELHAQRGNGREYVFSTTFPEVPYHALNFLRISFGNSMHDMESSSKRRANYRGSSYDALCRMDNYVRIYLGRLEDTIANLPAEDRDDIHDMEMEMGDGDSDIAGWLILFKWYFATTTLTASV